jgi:hypothetical protein
MYALGVTVLGVTVLLYFAAIARRLARRAARVASTGGGEGGMSSSNSGSGAAGSVGSDMTGLGDGEGMRLGRGDILMSEISGATV